jgi:predicted GTPase
VVINKIDTAAPENIQKVRESIARVNSNAIVVDAASPILVDNPDIIKGKRVLVIEDGPTLTHGEMTYGSGIVAAQRYGAKELVDPRPYTVGTITETFKHYPYIEKLLPAIGYGKQQLKDLEATINKVDCDAVVVATPINLSRVININKPNTRVYYELQEIGRPNLDEIVSRFVKEVNLS